VDFYVVSVLRDPLRTNVQIAADLEMKVDTLVTALTRARRAGDLRLWRDGHGGVYRRRPW